MVCRATLASTLTTRADTNQGTVNTACNGSTTASTNTRYVMMFQHGTTSSRIYFKGVFGTTQTFPSWVAAFSGTVTMQLGMNTSGFVLHEIQFCKGYDSDATIATRYAALKTKWSVAV